MSRTFRGAAAGSGVVGVIGMCAAAGYALGAGVRPTVHNRMFPWIVARASGTGAFVALTVIVLLGLLFRRPAKAGSGRVLQKETLLRYHVYLGPALIGLILVHIGSLLADRYAGVGWKTLVVPNAATYRPGAVTLGLFSFYLVGVVAMTAKLAGRPVVRHRWVWLHRLAYPAFLLAWGHGVLAGSDTTSLRLMYILAGLSVGAATLSLAFRQPVRTGAGAGT